MQTLYLNMQINLVKAFRKAHIFFLMNKQKEKGKRNYLVISENTISFIFSDKTIRAKEQFPQHWLPQDSITAFHTPGEGIFQSNLVISRREQTNMTSILLMATVETRRTKQNIINVMETMIFCFTQNSVLEQKCHSLEQRCFFLDM